MSHHLTNQTWDIELRAMQKIVLLCLSHLSAQTTRECAPTVQKIAYMCGMSDSTVRDKLDALAAAGLVEEISGDGETFYRVNVAPRDA